MEPTELTPEQVAAAAASPSSVTVDGTTVQARSADDTIKLDQYAQQKANAASGGAQGARRMRFSKAILPGHT